MEELLGEVPKNWDSESWGPETGNYSRHPHALWNTWGIWGIWIGKTRDTSGETAWVIHYGGKHLPEKRPRGPFRSPHAAMAAVDDWLDANPS